MALNSDFLRSFHGVVALIQVILGFITLFVCAFIWRGGDVFIQFVYWGYGWQTVINLVVLFTWLLAVFTLFAGLSGRDFRGDIGKRNLLIVYSICIFFLLIAGVLEAWYANIYPHGLTYKPRFVIACICIWIQFASYIALLIVTIIFN